MSEVTKTPFIPAAPEAGGESPVSANVKLIGQNGADILLTVRAGATIEQVVGVLDVMAQGLKVAKDKYHLTPAPARNGASASQANGSAPMCPDGHGPMKPSTKGSGWFCPKSVGEHPQTGKKLYCTHKVAA